MKLVFNGNRQFAKYSLLGFSFEIDYNHLFGLKSSHYSCISNPQSLCRPGYNFKTLKVLNWNTKFIVRLQVSVKLSMILPRKQMPVSTLNQGAPSLLLLSELEQNASKCLVSQSFSREDSKRLCLWESFNYGLCKCFVNRAPFSQKGRHCLSALGRSLSTRVSTLASLLGPQGMGRELSIVCCRLRSQIDREAREVNSMPGIFKEWYLSKTRVSGFQLHLPSLCWFNSSPSAFLLSLAFLTSELMGQVFPTSELIDQALP